MPEQRLATPLASPPASRVPALEIDARATGTHTFDGTSSEPAQPEAPRTNTLVPRVATAELDRTRAEPVCYRAMPAVEQVPCHHVPLARMDVDRHADADRRGI